MKKSSEENQLTPGQGLRAPICSVRDPRRRGSLALTGILMASMLAGGAFMGGFGRRSAYDERHDPDRAKTPEDLANIEAARLKRERKGAKRHTQNNLLSRRP
jgi:hypothetical protein